MIVVVGWPLLKKNWPKHIASSLYLTNIKMLRCCPEVLLSPCFKLHVFVEGITRVLCNSIFCHPLRCVIVEF